MELLIFGHAGARVLVFPTRSGRFYDYENWGMIDSIRPKIEQGWLQLFCVDSIDSESLYNHGMSPKDRITRHVEYEAYILHEVLPLTRAYNTNMYLIAHGCSMGAFHAVNFALRHPQQVGRVVALSGRYDLTRPLDTFPDLFDGYYDETIYFNTPTHFLSNLHDEQVLGALRHIEITLVVGERDPFLVSNRDLSHMLWERGVWHSLHIWNGRAHRPYHWQKMADVYL